MYLKYIYINGIPKLKQSDSPSFQKKVGEKSDFRNVVEECFRRDIFLLQILTIPGTPQLLLGGLLGLEDGGNSDSSWMCPTEEDYDLGHLQPEWARQRSPC